MKGNMPFEKKELMMHLNEHVSYPATKNEILKACNEMSDVPEEEKEMFTADLPEKTYNNAEEIVNALNLK